MKHTCFIVVTLIVLESILDMTESFVCEPPSVYHNHTRTCVRLVQEKRAHAIARRFCADSFKGDLVFIYDSETSSFIKVMLRTWNIEEALIGLHNIALLEQYMWGDNRQNATYYDWATPSYVEDKTKRAVVATATGWRKHDYFTPADFICQSATAVLPEVVLSCPVAEEGKQNHSLWCSVETYEDSQNPSIQFCKDNSKSWCPTHSYTTNMQTHGSNITAQLNISTVRRKDEGTWTCFISFTVSSGTHHMNKSCNLNVYSIPQTPFCQHTSNTTHVLVTCSTIKVYPEARCVWGSTFGIERIEVLPESTQHKKYIRDETVYYNTTCTASFRPDVTGVFKIVVTMFANYSQSIHGVTQDYNITIVQNVLSATECPHLDVSLVVSDSRKIDTGSDVSDTNLLYYIIPPCLVVLIAIVTALSVKKGCTAYVKKRQHKAESNLNTTSMRLPLDEDGYLLVLGASVGLHQIDNTHSNVQPVVGSDVEHESVGNVRVDITRNRGHALEGPDNENPYNVIQETEDTMDHVGSNEQRNSSTRQETDQTLTSENVSGPSGASGLMNVYDRLDENSYNDYLDVYNIPN